MGADVPKLVALSSTVNALQVEKNVAVIASAPAATIRTDTKQKFIKLRC